MRVYTVRVCVSPPPAQPSLVEETSTQREWEPGTLASRAVKEGGESREEGGGRKGEGSKVRVGGQLGLDYNAITGGCSDLTCSLCFQASNSLAWLSIASRSYDSSQNKI